MAEVDFGDSELFEQFDEDRPVPKHTRFTDHEDSSDELSELQEKLEECEETIGRLKAENQELKRKLNILSRPSGIHVENPKFDGPLFQILFGNNAVSKQCRQEVEDYIVGLIEKHQQSNEAPTPHVYPQNSSVVLEENHKTKASTTLKKIQDAFSMVGSVLYFTSFCLDKLGQPLLNENPQLTEGWEVPKYLQVFGQVITLEGQEMQIKERRPRPCCFNCGDEGHQLRDCPKPKDMARINEKRKEFSQGSTPGNQRYHAEEVEERFAKYKAGTVSEELMDALGVAVNTLPPFIYRMRELGYPPGWLKEAEMENSGLTLYDGNTSTDGDNDPKVSYDVSKLVDFPGFNIPAPSDVKDEFMSYYAPPMQPQHMKQNFAAYLSKAFPMPGSNCNKRRHDSDSTPRPTKKRRSNPDTSRSSDMDVESEQDIPQSKWSSDGFQFQPPLPPSSPSFGTPPPLPLGTPPVTPTQPPLPKGTPPPTPPANGSPALQSRGDGPPTLVGEESEDGLTLEELEEQQRLIWAALEKADTATNSDSETGATGTPVPSSPSVSTPARADPEEGEEDEEMKMEQNLTRNGEDPEMNKEEVLGRNGEDLSPVSPPTGNTQVTTVEDHNNHEVGRDGQGRHSHKNLSDVDSFGCNKFIVLDETDEEDVEEKDHEVDASEAALALQTPVPSDSQTGSMEVAEDKNEDPAVCKISAVPHRSKFAEGIIPFEDTPEFTEVAEATGVYLKIRDLLKGSPRNQARNKK